MIDVWENKNLGEEKRGLCQNTVFLLMNGSVEILFPPVVRIFSYGCQEGDPLSPPEGEAAQGAYPLDPLLDTGQPYGR